MTCPKKRFSKFLIYHHSYMINLASLKKKHLNFTTILMMMIGSSKIPLHNNQVMPNYQLCFLLLFVIYASMPPTMSGANQPSDPGSVYKSLNRSKTPPECKSRSYSSCLESATNDNSTLAQGDSIRYGESLISKGGTFKLGFFVLGGNTYLGIWYGTNPEVIVWTANRNNPISAQQQHKCSVVVAQDGIAKLLDSNNHSLWSTNSKKTYGGIMLLQLLDSGNLVLKDRSTRETIVWQSFENPTDTILGDQWMNFNTSVYLRSWKRPDSPAEGYYMFQRAISTDYNLSITRNDSSSIPYWASSLSNLPTELTSFLDGTSKNATKMRLYLSPNGRIQLLELDKSRGQNWTVRWIAPKDQCDLYQTCGSFGVCDAGNGFMCKCLPGFTPNDPARWESKDFSADQCSRGVETCTDDEFLSLPMINVRYSPDSNSHAQTEDECKDGCTKSCGCKAYSFDPDAQSHSNCQLWTKDLYDIQEEYYNKDNRTLSIRVASSDLDFGKNACKICGTNVIPYPLSTDYSCGNPNYLSFQCNSSNGQVYFRPALIGSLYKVSHINPADMKFVVQLPQHENSDKCGTIHNVFNLGSSSPFNVTNCSVVDLIDRRVVEVEMSWEPPPPPPCSTPADCNYWPNTSCYDAKVCKCAKGFHSHLQFLNCTQGQAGAHTTMSFWVKVGIASTCGVILLLGIVFFVLHLRKKKATQRLGVTELNKDNDIEDIDIPFVDYESILYATNKFSDANKLGVGGFGPVYKGELADGNAIAVKRLSAASLQGIEEFRNEVILIAKLQHRNLVRVLGYCVKENEKILIYEYMPNRSLDAFLFDHTISMRLDWIKRFNIILGIARGLLYLHQDSRLIIIHRDMKPSNILLDEELNPKISDFGLARIVAGNEMATSTARVVGTHGYMSPEYALDGYFSIKSDVYSFGIIVLETIIGKRCTSLINFDDSLISLLGYAWFLWDRGNPLELVDKSVESYDISEVKRCINVGLLCVQEDPSDRPNMSTVLLMLGGDSMNLSYPKQPVFVSRRQPSETNTSSSSKFGMSSNTELATIVEGR